MCIRNGTIWSVQDYNFHAATSGSSLLGCRLVAATKQWFHIEYDRRKHWNPVANVPVSRTTVALNI